MSGAILARYDYDLYGVRTKVSGALDSDIGYAGYHFHGQSNLNFAPRRCYSAGLGRWISRDALMNAEISQGPNLYAFVRNQPLFFRDTTGYWFEWVPLIGTVEQAIRVWVSAQPGMKVSDYAKYAGPNPQCSYNIDRAAFWHGVNLSIPSAVRVGLDVAIGILTTAFGGPIAIPVDIAMVIDAMAGIAGTVWGARKIRDAAALAKIKYCDCK